MLVLPDPHATRPTQSPSWQDLADSQGGLITRRQLADHGVDSDRVRNRVDSGRWLTVGPTVVSLTTGTPTNDQVRWAGVLHAGEPAALCGLSALIVAGLAGWDRPWTSVVIPKSDDRVELPGVKYVETRRNIPALTLPHTAPPRLDVEAAALLFAAYDRSERTAAGLLSAVVQQGLTTPTRLADRMKELKPLRRAPLFRHLLVDIEGGAQSLNEVEVARLCQSYGLIAPRRQSVRMDRYGKRRYLDNEWDLESGEIVVLEVDGAFHTEVQSWWADMARERELVIDGRRVLRCSSVEVRSNPDRIVRDLMAIGVPRSRPVGDAL
jgi:hypothetical protein